MSSQLALLPGTQYQEEPVPFFSGSPMMALHEKAQESSQALQRTEHYASVAYRLVYFIQRLLKLAVHQQTTHLQTQVLCISVLLSSSFVAGRRLLKEGIIC